ncbi:wall-associated receptor kinase 1-like isoform X2 [Triticum urartu]|uniref:wall-associated receptor kinase 1-like isoform X2 n=1 Tax=Triticum urartu TaxID=4572 RepID=UPI0020448C33|nr:wall-associated receptor kinase 1-like isoform X2 [Triticum urartu]
MTTTRSSQSHNSQPLPIILVLLAAAAAASTPLILQAAAAAAEQDEKQPITLPGCPDRCGDTLIPFPFGTKPGCFREGFQVTCNDSFTPHRAFLAYAGVNQHIAEIYYKVGWHHPVWRTDHGNTALELIDISVADGEARAYGLVSSLCNAANLSGDYVAKCQNLALGERGPFLLSVTRNLLVGVGWRVEPKIMSYLWSAYRNSTYEFSLACLSDLMGMPKLLQLATNGSCSSRGCCQAALPEAAPLTDFGTWFTIEDNPMWQTNPCTYAMVVESDWYRFSTPDLYGVEVLPRRYPRGVPFVLDFSIRNGACPGKGQKPPPDYACVSGNSYCANATGGAAHGYVCRCLEHYDGNPYIANGCQDIDECKLRKLNPELYPCSSDGICKNRLEGYDCPCKLGMKGDGGIGGIFIIAAISFLILLHKEKQKTREFYQKNGGPTLEKAKFIKLFKKEELKPILKSSNFIGKGGFGEVYKGFLDNEEVAVKKPISGTMLENEQFANEVIIQSRVIHKNIVRLIGCCLEVDIPMLVYEFLSNGSLDDILHGKKKVALNLGVRLSIAVESADALVYMHSKTNAKIIHGDVKPANILLDDKFAPKISDFGISRLIARDKKHTGSVIGDMSYIDPVYLQTGLLTEKSDVYSFGVVILELISRQKATHSDGGSLVNSFLEAGKKEKKVTELFDKEIVAEGDLEILDSLAAIALECLNLDVDQRPSMTEVVERLLIMNRSRKS